MMRDKKLLNQTPK